DEVKLLEIVKEYLLKEGYEVYTSTNGEEALKLFDIVKPDFLILDLMLPGISGEDICLKIREKSTVPIIMLTAKTSEEEKINGLSIGADDYITKPFSPRELVMRVKTVLRRVGGEDKNILSYNNGDLEINIDEMSVRKKGSEIKFTPNEYSILLILAQNSNKVFSRTNLIDSALGYDYVGYERTIDTHIKNIRQKIETNIKEPQYLVTVYGMGYKFLGDQK
ncbi:MAG: response regulator transcription factor, partial [Eubacteriales bacterium]